MHNIYYIYCVDSQRFDTGTKTPLLEIQNNILCTFTHAWLNRINLHIHKSISPPEDE
jgi:hypothetical protein